MKTNLTMLAALTTAGVIGLSGCGSSGSGAADPGPTSASHSTSPKSPSTSASPSTPMGDMAMITIKNFAFTGSTTVAPGADVMVANSDGETHTLTSDEAGMFDVNVPGGGSGTFTAPTKPGSYAYHCSFHSNMSGTLVVK